MLGQHADALRQIDRPLQRYVAPQFPGLVREDGSRRSRNAPTPIFTIGNHQRGWVVGAREFADLPLAALQAFQAAMLSLAARWSPFDHHRSGLRRRRADAHGIE